MVTISRVIPSRGGAVKVILVLLLLCLLVGPWAEAVTYYVDPSHPSASDTNAGTSEALPWSTALRATTNGTEVAAGDTVYFKTATYDAGAPGQGVTPWIPANSGTAGNPIAFRRFPGHTPSLTRTDEGGDNPATLGFGARNFIIFDGFTAINGSGINGGTGDSNIIENCTFDATGRVLSADENAAPMNFGAASNAIIRNNLAGGARAGPAANGSSLNIIGVPGTQARGFLVHNNEFYGGDSAVGLKRRNQDHIFEKNYFRDTTQEGFQTGSEAGTTETNIIIRQNIFFNIAGHGVRFNMGGAQSDHQVYNNTVYGVASQGIRWATAMTGTAQRVYNNIVILPSTSIAHTMFDGPTSDTEVLIDFNAYFGTTGAFAQFREENFGPNLTLAQWRTAGFDANALASDPLLVGPFTGTPPTVNFRVQASSPTLGAGRVGGLSTGAARNMGAYILLGGGRPSISSRPQISLRPVVATRPSVTLGASSELGDVIGIP